MLKSAVIEEKKVKNIESKWFGPRSMNDFSGSYRQIHSQGQAKRRCVTSLHFKLLMYTSGIKDILPENGGKYGSKANLHNKILE